MPPLLRNCLAAALLAVIAAGTCFAQAPSASSPAQDQLIKNTEKYLRNYFAWGDDYGVKVGPLESSPDPNFYTVPIQVTYKGETSSGDVYVSKDGKTLLRGELLNMTVDAFAENSAKLKLQGSPSLGPADAPITMVEFYDFECPHCREADSGVKALADQYKLRLVYKNFPLTTIHQWAETAAIGGECAFMVSNEAFLKFHDLVFENQDVILPENVSDKLADYAVQAGIGEANFKACMASPEAKNAVEADIQEAHSLDVDSTPTFFINGRELVGGDIGTLQRIIEYEQNHHAK